MLDKYLDGTNRAIIVLTPPWKHVWFNLLGLLKPHHPTGLGNTMILRGQVSPMYLKVHLPYSILCLYSRGIK